MDPIEMPQSIAEGEAWLAAVKAEGAGPAQVATAELFLAQHLTAAGKTTVARVHLQAARDGYREAGDDYGEGAVLMEEAMIHAHHQHYRRAAASYRKAIRHWDKLGEAAHVAEACYALGLLALDSDRLADGVKALERARKVWVSLGNATGEALTQEALGEIHSLNHDIQATQMAMERAAELWQNVEAPSRAAEVLADLGDFLLSHEVGRPAIAAYRSALLLWRQAEDQGGEARMLGALGMAYRMMGRRRDALGYLRQALPLVAAAGDLKGEMFYAFGVGVLLSESGQYVAAATHLERGVELAERLRYEDIEGDRALLRRVRSLARRARMQGSGAPFIQAGTESDELVEQGATDLVVE